MQRNEKTLCFAGDYMYATPLGSLTYHYHKKL